MTVTKTNSTPTSAHTVNNATENKKKKNKTRKIEELLNNEDDITWEDRAPDGGWGWIIALAMIFTYITTIGPSPSFGIYFGDFIQASGQAGLASGLFNSSFMISFSIASLLTNTLLKRYSTRPVGIAGALLFAITDIMLAFVRNIFDMAFLFLIQGFGLGLIITVCNTVFNAYFVKKRTKVMSAAQVIIALGGIVYPTLIEKSMILYGFRGTSAIIGAISLNGIVGMALMHPVEWHLRNIDVVRAEKAREKEQKCQELALSSQRYLTIDVIPTSSKTKWSSLQSLKEESDIQVPLLNDTFKPSAQRVASISELESEIRERSKSVSMRENLTRRMSALSASSVVNLATSVGALGDIRQQYLEKRNSKDQTNKEILKERENEKENAEEKQEESKYKKFVKELLDMSLVKDWAFMNLCIGVSLVLTADYAFSSFLPLIMTDVGYTKRESALTITISGIAELVSRVFLAAFTMIVDVKAKYLFFAAMILMEFARIGFLLCEHTLMGALIMTALIGFARSWLLVPQNIVIIEDVSIEQFASAYGIFGIISGLVTIVCGAIVGFVKDWTDSYDMYQISLLVLHGAFIIPWALQFIFVDLRKHRKQRAQKVIIKSISRKE
ncbi:monocarboxylate transporter 9-like [Nylanderia fulva]|uniref:monocarboxylate transporter 9-like n=1 Tax=Nylanderia fulva TaxID=613905 RepID=UPI0010FB0D87|nr:monocarboxylate transporter 9-like [Nylanderia fulva]XP_029173660.1 monocarboxylate transporter 9-like [Nylanderia fulva]XP_029173661.1 monocarboxylate transporter 9-like [Nylanderia fulva]